MIEATAIGAVQACYVLLGLDFVISTRTVQNINSLPRSKLNNALITDKLHLSTMEDDECAVLNGIQSQLGRRDAYNKLVKQQHLTYSTCFITYYIMLTYYSLSIRATTGKNLVTAPPLLKLDTTGKILDAPTKFRVDNIIYILKKRPIVINLSPHIPYDLTNEISCHSILLMHYPWPMHGEMGLVLSEAIDSVKNLLHNEIYQRNIGEIHCNLRCREQ